MKSDVQQKVSLFLVLCLFIFFIVGIASDGFTDFSKFEPSLVNSTNCEYEDTYADIVTEFDLREQIVFNRSSILERGENTDCAIWMSELNDVGATFYDFTYSFEISVASMVEYLDSWDFGTIKFSSNKDYILSNARVCGFYLRFERCSQNALQLDFGICIKYPDDYRNFSYCKTRYVEDDWPGVISFFAGPRDTSGNPYVILTYSPISVKSYFEYLLLVESIPSGGGPLTGEFPLLYFDSNDINNNPEAHFDALVYYVFDWFDSEVVVTVDCPANSVSHSFIIVEYWSYEVIPGYTFLGWYYDEALTQPYAGERYLNSSDLYKNYVINQYTVVFNSDGGSCIDDIVTDFNTSILPETPKKRGCRFLGWYYDDGTKYENQAIKSDIVLNAHWEDMLTCSVEFFLDGELYRVLDVEYGTTYSDIVILADSLNLQVMSITSDDVQSFLEAVVIDDNVVVNAVQNEFGKTATFVSNNKMKIVIAVVGALLLISAVCVLPRTLKRRRRR